MPANFRHLSDGRPVLGRPSLDPEGGSHGTRHINIAGPLVTPGPAPALLRALPHSIRDLGRADVRRHEMQMPPEEGRLMTLRMGELFAGYGGESDA